MSSTTTLKRRVRASASGRWVGAHGVAAADGGVIVDVGDLEVAAIGEAPGTGVRGPGRMHRKSNPLQKVRRKLEGVESSPVQYQ